MREQYDQSRKKVSRNCLLLGALEVVLGVLVYFEIAEFPPLPFTGVSALLGRHALAAGRRCGAVAADGEPDR